MALALVYPWPTGFGERGACALRDLASPAANPAGLPGATPAVTRPAG